MEDKKVEKFVEYLPGGMAEGMTAEDVAKIHGVEVSVINKQIKMGVKIEKEHSANPEVQAEICRDHLTETPFYYDYLEEMEKTFKENLKEDLERGGMETEEEEHKKGRKATEDDAKELIKKSPNPEDEVLHEFAEEKEINVPSLEAQMYKLATKYVQEEEKEEEEDDEDSLMDAKKKEEKKKEDPKKKEKKEEEDPEEEEEEEEEEDPEEQKKKSEEEKKKAEELKKKGMKKTKKDSVEIKNETLQRLFG